MKKLILTISLLLVSISSHSKDVKGEMRCEVKSNYLLKIEEGKPTTFSGYSDMYEVGDELVFSFELNRISERSSGYIELGLHYEDYPLVLTMHQNNLPMIVARGHSLNTGFATATGIPRINEFSSNDIKMDTIFNSGTLSLTRYYKSDWSGFLISYYPATNVQVSSLDCRQPYDKLDEFIGEVIKSNGTDLMYEIYYNEIANDTIVSPKLWSKAYDMSGGDLAKQESIYADLRYRAFVEAERKLKLSY